jgi:hypothetical protein
MSLTTNDMRVLESIRMMPSDWDGWAPHGSADWTAVRRLVAAGRIVGFGTGVCCDCDTERHRYEPTEIPMYRLAQQPPQPLEHVQQPARDANGQQHGDEGEGV